MRVVALFPSKTERSVFRQAVTGFKVVDMPTSLPELLDEIRKPTALEFLIICDMPENDGVLEALETAGSRTTGAAPVICMVMNEGNEVQRSERTVAYSQLGVDFFLNRPYGVNDFKQKVEEARTWIENPPAHIQAMRQMRTLVKGGRAAEAEAGLTKLYSADPENLPVAMLFAEVLVKLGGPKVELALTVLNRVEKKYPTSLLSKKLLLQAHRARGDMLAEVKVARAIWLLQENDANYARVLELTKDLEVNVERKDSVLDFLGIMQKRASVKNLEQRARLFEMFLTSVEELRDVQDFLETLEGHPDLGSRLKPQLKNLLAKAENMEAEKTAEPWLYELVRVKALRKILDVEPGEPDSLNKLVDLLINQKDFESAYVYLTAAREAKNFSAHYYAASTRLALAEGRLKDASESLQAGRRLKPTDDRWTAYSKTWQDLYDAKEAAQTAEPIDPAKPPAGEKK